MKTLDVKKLSVSVLIVLQASLFLPAMVSAQEEVIDACPNVDGLQVNTIGYIVNDKGECDEYPAGYYPGIGNPTDFPTPGSYAPENFQVPEESYRVEDPKPEPIKEQVVQQTTAPVVQQAAPVQTPASSDEETIALMKILIALLMQYIALLSAQSA